MQPGGSGKLMGTKAIFLDRDGTLNEMVYDETHGLLDSPRRPEQVVLMDGVAAFMREARESGYKLVVVTNQPGIAKGTLTLTDLDLVNGRLAELMKLEGAWWDALFFCPHHPKGQPGVASPYVMDCDCRKPKPGMLLRAAAELDIDLHASWMVGDGLNDIQAGNTAGCRTVLVTSLKLEQIQRFLSLDQVAPTSIAPDMNRVAKQLVASS
jgi:histidinol-phosphate phosphatase family protein